MPAPWPVQLSMTLGRGIRQFPPDCLKHMGQSVPTYGAMNHINHAQLNKYYLQFPDKHIHIYRLFHKTLPRSSVFVNWISVFVLMYVQFFKSWPAQYIFPFKLEIKAFPRKKFFAVYCGFLVICSFELKSELSAFNDPGSIISDT